MAEEDKTPQPAAPKASKLPWIMLAVVTLAGAGGAAYFLMGVKKADKTKAGPASPATQMGPLLPVDSMIVNLDEPGGNRYLKISFSLELEHDLDDARRQLMPRLRDEVLVYLSSFTVEQIQKPQTKLEIKRKLKDLANKVFGQPVAKQVYFKELVMQ